MPLLQAWHHRQPYGRTSNRPCLPHPFQTLSQSESHDGCAWYHNFLRPQDGPHNVLHNLSSCSVFLIFDLFGCKDTNYFCISSSKNTFLFERLLKNFSTCDLSCLRIVQQNKTKQPLITLHTACRLESDF